MLVLSNASFLQGIAEKFDGDITGEGGQSECGQAITLDFYERIQDNETEEIYSIPEEFKNHFYVSSDIMWNRIFTYRRSLAHFVFVSKDDYVL